MARTANALYIARMRATPLSPLILMSDPDRIPNIYAAAKRLPYGAAVIYRHFGKAGHRDEAIRLRQITFARGQQLLIGADPKLAIEVGADGVHFRRDAEVALPNLWRRRCPDWIITMAGLKGGAEYRGDLTRLDGLIVSSVFASQSPSAGNPIGVEAFMAMCRDLPVSVIALGGIHSGNVGQLIGSGAAGLAGVSGILSRSQTR